MDPAWLAGFFDGEGCVTAEQHPPRARVQITQRKRAVLDEIMATYGGNIYRLPHGTHILQIARATEVQAILEAIEPHVRLKQREVQTALTLTALVNLRKRDEETRRRRYEIGDELRALTKRRVPEPGEPRLRYQPSSSD